MRILILAHQAHVILRVFSGICMMMMFTYREECSYICSCFCFLAVGPPCDCRVVYTPAAEASVDTKWKMIPRTQLFIIKV